MRKVEIPRHQRTMMMSPPASPSSPSVILIALTIPIVVRKVKIGKKIQISIFHPRGRRLI